MGESHTQFEPEIYEKDASDFTREELVDALCNLKGVKFLKTIDNGCILRIGQDWKVKGKATIIVVKE